MLAIVGLMVLAVPALLSANLPGARADAAARALAQDLRLARQAAIISGAETSFVLTAGSYAVTPGGTAHALPAGVSARIDGGDGGTIRFYADGSATGGTITVQGAQRRHRITVDWLTGRIALDE